MNEKERLKSIEAKTKVLISLADDTGSGEANLLAIANDMRWLVSLNKKKVSSVTMPVKVWDKIHQEAKEVAVINYVERYVYLWTNTDGARATVKRWFDDIEQRGADTWDT